MSVNWNLIPPGTMVRIVGGLLSDPEGNGIRWETPEPLPKDLKGTLGQLVPFKPVNGINLAGRQFYPFEPWLTRIMENLTVVEVTDGPLVGTLLNRDLLDLELLTPLGILGAQAD